MSRCCECGKIVWPWQKSGLFNRDVSKQPFGLREIISKDMRETGLHGMHDKCYVTMRDCYIEYTRIKKNVLLDMLKKVEEDEKVLRVRKDRVAVAE